MPNSASLTQNMNIMHLKTQVSGSTHSTQQDPLKNAPQKSTVQKMMDPTPSVAWTWALLGHRTTVAVPLQHHSGTPRARDVSRGGAATRIVQSVPQGALTVPPHIVRLVPHGAVSRRQR